MSPSDRRIGVHNRRTCGAARADQKWLSDARGSILPMRQPRVRVVVGALVRDGRVLLAHRRPDKRAFPDVWDLPGGVMEARESEQQALERELREELGVRVTSASHLCRVTVGPQNQEAVLSAWLVREWDGMPANVAPEEHVDIGWFAAGDVPPLVDPRVRAAVLGAMA